MKTIVKPIITCLIALIAITVLLTRVNTVTDKWTNDELDYALRTATQDATSVMLDSGQMFGTGDEMSDFTIDLLSASTQFSDSFYANIGSTITEQSVNDMNITLSGYIGYDHIYGVYGNGNSTMPMMYSTEHNGNLVEFTLGDKITMTDLSDFTAVTLSMQDLPEYYFNDAITNNDFRTMTIMSTINSFLTLFYGDAQNTVAYNAGSGVEFSLGLIDYAANDHTVMEQMSSVIDGPGFFAVVDMQDAKVNRMTRVLSLGAAEMVSGFANDWTPGGTTPGGDTLVTGFALSYAEVFVGDTAAPTLTILPAGQTVTGLIYDIMAGEEFVTLNAATGAVTGIAPGSATIRVTGQDANGDPVSAVTSVRVKTVGIESVALAYPEVSIGKTAGPILTLLPANHDAYQSISYRVTGGTRYLSVDPVTGVITGLADGIAIVKVTVVDSKGSTLTAICTVTVSTEGISSATLSYASVEKGSTSDPRLTLLPAGNDGYRSIKYEVISGATYASVDTETGVATGLKAGTATIRATITDYFGHIITTTGTFTVKPKSISGVTLSYEDVTRGDVVAPIVTISPSDYDTYQSISYEVVSGAEYASVSATTGKVTGLAMGTATIRVTVVDANGNTKTATANANVLGVAITRVTLAYDDVEKGETVNPTLTITPAGADPYQSIKYELTSGSAYASVDANTGIVTGLSKGSASVRVTIVDARGNTRTAIATVNVKQTVVIVDVTGVSLSYDDLIVGDTVMPALTIEPGNYSPLQSVSYTILSGVGKVMVDSSTGALTGTSAGTATIQVTVVDASGNTKTATASVTVTDPASFSIGGTTYDFNNGETWAEWCASENNTGGWYVGSDGKVYNTEGRWVWYVDANILSSSVIYGGREYLISYNVSDIRSVDFSIYSVLNYVVDENGAHLSETEASLDSHDETIVINSDGYEVMTETRGRGIRIRYQAQLTFNDGTQMLLHYAGNMGFVTDISFTATRGCYSGGTDSYGVYSFYYNGIFGDETTLPENGSLAITITRFGSFGEMEISMRDMGYGTTYAKLTTAISDFQLDGIAFTPTFS